VRSLSWDMEKRLKSYIEDAMVDLSTSFSYTREDELVKQ